MGGSFFITNFFLSFSLPFLNVAIYPSILNFIIHPTSHPAISSFHLLSTSFLSLLNTYTLSHPFHLICPSSLLPKFSIHLSTTSCLSHFYFQLQQTTSSATTTTTKAFCLKTRRSTFLKLLKLKVKVANEWQEQVTGLGLEIEHRNYSMIDAQVPSPPT